MKITCCKDCVPPKRYPGCHIVCKEYIEQKAEYEKERELIKQSRKNSQPLLTNYDFNKIVYANCKNGRKVRRRKR